MAAVDDLSSAAQRGLRRSAVLEPHPDQLSPRPGRTRATLRPREEWIEIPIPAIIDEATLEAVAATARDNSSYSPRRTEPDTFLLRRLLRCAHCQVKLNCYRARRNHTTTRYYLCPHRGAPAGPSTAAPNGASAPTN